MKFVFTDKKVNLPAVIHRYAEKKVGKLDRFFKEDATAAVTFSIERDRNRVEVTIPVWRHHLPRVGEHLRHARIH